MAISITSLAARLGAAIGGEHVDLDGDYTLRVRPGSSADAGRVLQLARDNRTPVVIGTAPEDGSSNARIRIDLGQMTSVLAVNETSASVHAQAGISIGGLAEILQPLGLSLGAMEAVAPHRTLGAVLAAPQPSEATPRGRAIDQCSALEAVLPNGNVIGTRLAPRRATGPDLAHVFLGARGTTGLITSAWIRAGRAPTHRAFLGYAFDDSRSTAPVDVGRTLLRRGLLPARMAIADQVFTADPLRSSLAGGVLLAIRIDGAREVVTAEEAMIDDVAESVGGIRIKPSVIESWLHGIESFAPTIAPDEFVPTAGLNEAWARRPAPSLLSGLNASGAALRTVGREPTAASAKPTGASRATAQLRQVLDRAGVLAG